ncbi:hypothetical protein AVEN_157465-1 [Araneus ventricosus]|uniref:Uncharacterized protein n=1 Tax=Araneus ventricosus TaxID=182803 RepID=A0A4Y2MDD0_ARAVE|nr:hypothetical protein AVEN_157465-1 [Araneus ventricosus]
MACRIYAFPNRAMEFLGDDVLVRMQKEEYEEWMSIDENIPVAASLTDLEICQAICQQDQTIKVDDSDGDE